MKKIITLITAILVVGSGNVGFAHPGRTDAKGGHTCWTKCKEWGLKYGEYHLHEKKVKVAKEEAKKEAKKETEKPSKISDKVQGSPEPQPAK